MLNLEIEMVKVNFVLTHSSQNEKLTLLSF